MLIKTEKARRELQPGNRTLGQRERAILLMADGRQDRSQVLALFNGEGKDLLDKLVHEGYLELAPSRSSASDARPGRTDTASGATKSKPQTPLLPAMSGIDLDDKAPSRRYEVQSRTTAATAPKTAPTPAAPPSASSAAHGDQFAGARSMASVRMFLFDMSERLFAPRDKAMALRYREALREAKDAEAMLRVSRAMVADVEAIAGAERADSISERLAKLLPPELLDR